MGPVTSARVNIELRRASGAEYFPYVGTAMTRPQPNGRRRRAAPFVSARRPTPTTAGSPPQPRSRCGEVGEEDHSGVEPLHVVELHPDGSSVAEHVNVSLAPDERVQVDLVLVDQGLLGEGVRELAAPVHEQVTLDLVLQLRDRVLEVPL